MRFTLFIIIQIYTVMSTNIFASNEQRRQQLTERLIDMHDRLKGLKVKEDEGFGDMLELEKELSVVDFSDLNKPGKPAKSYLSLVRIILDINPQWLESLILKCQIVSSLQYEDQSILHECARLPKLLFLLMEQSDTSFILQEYREDERGKVVEKNVGDEENEIQREDVLSNCASLLSTLILSGEKSFTLPNSKSHNPMMVPKFAELIFARMGQELTKFFPAVFPLVDDAISQLAAETLWQILVVSRKSLFKNYNIGKMHQKDFNNEMVYSDSAILFIHYLVGLVRNEKGSETLERINAYFADMATNHLQFFCLAGYMRLLRVPKFIFPNCVETRKYSKFDTTEGYLDFLEGGKRVSTSEGASPVVRSAKSSVGSPQISLSSGLSSRTSFSTDDEEKNFRKEGEEAIRVFHFGISEESLNNQPPWTKQERQIKHAEFHQRLNKLLEKRKNGFR